MTDKCGTASQNAKSPNSKMQSCCKNVSDMWKCCLSAYSKTYQAWMKTNNDMINNCSKKNLFFFSCLRWLDWEVWQLNRIDRASTGRQLLYSGSANLVLQIRKQKFIEDGMGKFHGDTTVPGKGVGWLEPSVEHVLSRVQVFMWCVPCVCVCVCFSCTFVSVCVFSLM